MKKKFTAIILGFIALTCSSAFIYKSSTGLAGYTGSPGEVTCGTLGCHGGGGGSAPAITITAVPAIDQGEYMPDSLYQISIDMSATGFNRFGFGCEILNNKNTNAGIMSLPGAGVKFLNAFNGRRNALHTTPKVGATVSFTFTWKAPATEDTVSFYVMGNAVNGNGSTSGDRPSAPVSLSLTPKPVPVDSSQDSSTASIPDLSLLFDHVDLYPNPGSELSQLNFNLKKSGNVLIALCDVRGRKVKEFLNEDRAAGTHSKILDLRGVEKGIYFVGISSGPGKVTRKLLIVQ